MELADLFMYSLYGLLALAVMGANYFLGNRGTNLTPPESPFESHYNTGGADDPLEPRF